MCDPARRIIVLCLILTALSAACVSQTDSPLTLAAKFKKGHDYQSLALLLSHVRLGMTRAEVEELLGRPDYSPIEGQYYYALSDRKTEEGTPVGLIVEYRRVNYQTGETVASGKLESLTLGPIGE